MRKIADAHRRRFSARIFHSYGSSPAYFHAMSCGYLPSPEATSTRDKRRHLALELISKKLPAAIHIAHVDALPRLVNLR